MIARLRRQHHRAWLILMVALATILVVAWSSRRPEHLMERLPAVLLENKAVP
jgi:hypothetical protein